ncbi:large conductance mechanosensitive channel protein MscL [Latilactobacillus curvatus]|uniref:large conductance mechanosensitive channel protein MscL n=1 Tax=Latilactobacillus curvatus TaxID=28038 RepID=UPI001CBB3F36|nr:large conductance mechanosensitive channel protein MscL [Latilactobacillus curvatus]MBZ1505076.1 large conductance mechanosensitive channel protein MscL [Latilactobacillus curvatus]MCM6844327.1 large conductance mechanosensitive channel protein MscL [Latilactobacillus curvatus]MCM6860786.1 large conductance mechanosensitive channel protein MscL [Latilactobacillus curvatus]MCM6868084.1 large conductance mechanosensitive channel protein MscL [Latilactobacillus curvatus]MDG2982174.1 large cond
MIKEFKEFIMRGNVLDMAVGVILGAALKSIVDSLTKNLINPIISLFVGQVDLSGIVLTIPGTKAVFKIGNFLNDVINFLIIAFVVFLIVKGFNKLRDMGKKTEEEEAQVVETKEEVYLKEIRDLLANKEK